MTESKPKVRLMRRAHGFVMYAYVGGRTRQRSTGTKDRRAAQRAASRWEREIREGRWTPGGGAVDKATVRTYAHDWTARREREGVRTAGQERTRFELHVHPWLGDRRVADLSAPEIRDWVLELRQRGELAAKTIRNVHGSLRSMLSDARFRGVRDDNPAADLPPGTLPQVDAPGRERRARAPSTYSREDVETLLVDPRIPEDRRVLYALLFLAGLRCGEAVGRRWRNLDTGAEPLERLAVESQYDDRPLKTGKPRLVPVHPELARVLEGWRRQGFARIFGRHPEPGDWIVPSRGRGKGGSGVRPGPSVYHSLQADCERVGVQVRRLHDTRHTFTTLARVDGADSFWLERVTHNAKGSMLDHYTGSHWLSLCEAVAALRVQLRRPADVVALRPTGSGGSDDGGAIAATIAADPGSPQTPVFQAAAGHDMGGEARCSAPASVRERRDSADLDASGHPTGPAYHPRRSAAAGPSIARAIDAEEAREVLREMAADEADARRRAALLAGADALAAQEPGE